jgi:magnesium-transporting ATPase (P-type)
MVVKPMLAARRMLLFAAMTRPTTPNSHDANAQAPAFWSVPMADLLQQLGATPQGLTSAEAQQRLARFGANLLTPGRRKNALALLLGQFKSPLILILLFAAGLSFFLHDPVDASIILAIVLASGLLGFWQERGAAHALEKLLAIVQTNAVVRRDGSEREIPVEGIVPPRGRAQDDHRRQPPGGDACRAAGRAAKLAGSHRAGAP